MKIFSVWTIFSLQIHDGGMELLLHRDHCSALILLVVTFLQISCFTLIHIIGTYKIDATFCDQIIN